MQKKATEPSIRFAGFTDPWERRKLGEIGVITTGSTPSTAVANNYSKDGMLWVTPTDISEYVTFETAKRLSKRGQQVARIVPKNTILVTCIASIGKNTMLGETGSFNQQINGLTADASKYDPYFLLAESVLWSKQMKRNAAAGTMQIVNRTEFSELSTCVPQIEEQRKIGSFISVLDNLITLHQRKREKLVNLKKAMLDKMFPKNGELVPEVRFAGFSGNWERRKMGEMAIFTRGSGLSWDDIDASGRHECILYGHLYTDYGMMIHHVKYHTNTIPNNVVVSCKGDVLVPGSDTTPTGLARATCIEKSGVILGGDINIIRPHGGMHGEFLSVVLNANKCEMIKHIKGTTVRHIHNSDIANISLMVSSNANEQSMIAALFSTLEAYIFRQQQMMQKLQKLKSAFLEKMFV